MYNVNPMQIIGMIKRGYNPQQLMMNFLEQNMKGTPMGDNILNLARNGQTREIEKIARELIEEQSCFSLKDLAVNGNDLIEAGFEKGKGLGEILEYLLDEVIEERAENEKETLLKIAKNKFGE